MPIAAVYSLRNLRQNNFPTRKADGFCGDDEHENVHALSRTGWERDISLKTSPWMRNNTGHKEGPKKGQVILGREISGEYGRVCIRTELWSLLGSIFPENPLRSSHGAMTWTKHLLQSHRTKTPLVQKLPRLYDYVGCGRRWREQLLSPSLIKSLLCAEHLWRLKILG